MKKNVCAEADLIKRILLGLPVESLLRFKAVCKTWCDLIQTPSFIDLHFKSSSSKRNSFILHAAVDFERFREDAVFMCSESFYVGVTPGFNGLCGWCVTNDWFWRTDDGFCASCKRSHNYVERNECLISDVYITVPDDNDDQYQTQPLFKLENLGFPSCYNFGKTLTKPSTVTVVGSCNGLICLHDSERSDVSLWNPATRQFRILPKSITFDGDCLHHCLFAFGFDAKTKDYQVVLLSGFRLRPRKIIDGELSVVVGPMECLCRVQVYSLSTDSWRLLEGINVLPGSPFPYPPDSSSGQLLYLNGSCFFMAKFLYSEKEQQCIPPPKDNDRFIIFLDLTKEMVIPIQLPDHRADEELYLCYLSKAIALYTKRIERGVNTVYPWERFGPDPWERNHIYLLNKHYGSNNNVDRESWTRIQRFGLPFEQNTPRGISNDGMFALLETGVLGGLGNKKRMKLYSLVTHKVKKYFLSCHQVLSNAYPYEPSLVSTIGGGNEAAPESA